MSDTNFISGLLDYLKEHKENNTVAKVVEAEQDRLSRDEAQTPEMPGKFEVTDKLAEDLGKILNIDFTAISRDEFKKGLEVEQEHVDVTQGDPETTAKIALAHLKEMPDYYTKLMAMEKGAGVKEATPPGAEYVVKGLKKSDVAKNPFAVAWWLRNQGAKFRKGPHAGKRMASVESIDKIIEDISKVTTPDLDMVDISKLDQFEKMQYNRMISNSSKAEVLQILINSTEGDFSQLSDELRQYAEKDTTWKNESAEDEEPLEGDITTEDHEHWYQYGKLYFTGDYVDLKKKMKVDKFWPNVFFISDHGNAHLVTESTKVVINAEKINRIGAIKEALTPEQEKLVAELANDVKPYVDKIEARIATTKGHYGDYMELLSQWQKEPRVMMVMAMACKKAGADPQGVNDALRMLTGKAFESVNKAKESILDEVCFLVWDKKTNNIKVNDDGDVLQFPNSGKADAYITDVLGEIERYELLPRATTGTTPKINKPALATEAAQDSLKVIARSLSDKADADRVALSKKGRVIADDKDPKKFMVVVQEARINEVKFVILDLQDMRVRTKSNNRIMSFDSQGDARDFVTKVLGTPSRYEILACTNSGLKGELMMNTMEAQKDIDVKAMKEAIKKGEPDASDEVVDKIFAKQVAAGTGIIFLKQEKDDEQKTLIGDKKVKENNTGSVPVTKGSASREVVPVSAIRVGDTVVNKNGQEVTVGKNDIKNDKFIGITLFGDSYKLGTEKVTRIVHHNKKVKESVMSDADVEIEDLVNSGANDADIIKAVAGKYRLYPRDVKLAIQKHRMQDATVEKIMEEVYKIWDRTNLSFVKDGGDDAYFMTKDEAREKITVLGPEKGRYEILPESRQLKEDITTLAGLSKEFNTPLIDVTNMYNTAKALRLKAVNKTAQDALDVNDNKFIMSVVRHRLRMRSNSNGGKNA